MNTASAAQAAEAGIQLDQQQPPQPPQQDQQAASEPANGLEQLQQHQQQQQQAERMPPPAPRQAAQHMSPPVMQPSPGPPPMERVVRSGWRISQQPGYIRLPLHDNLAPRPERGTHGHSGSAGARVCDDIAMDDGDGGEFDQQIDPELAALRTEAERRLEVGLTGLTADQLQGPRAELYGRAGLRPQQPTAATLLAFHAMGVGGGVQPASAPVGDRALTKTPPELRFFSGKGAHGSRRSNKPHYVALGPQADGSFGVMVGGGVSDEISIDQRSTTRRLGLFAAMRVRWMLTVVDETHPAFLDLPYTAAALDYAMYIGVLELDHPTYAVEQFDSAVMFQLHLGAWQPAWRWTDPLPPAPVYRLGELRKPRDQ